MSFQYTVVSWNIGRDHDFLDVCERSPSFSDQDLIGLGRKRESLFLQIFQQLNQDFSPSFYCFQEVSSRVKLRHWLGREYALAGVKNNCAIAWDQRQFDIVPQSVTQDRINGRYIIANLREKSTGEIASLASAHLWGFNLANPKQSNTRKGDRLLESLIRDINKEPADHEVIGIDANTPPHIHPDRLKLIEEEGYFRDEEEEAPTAYNHTLPSRRAKLDYIFARSGRRVKPTLKTKSHRITLESPHSNPSDHRPIINSLLFRRHFSVRSLLRK